MNKKEKNYKMLAIKLIKTIACVFYMYKAQDMINDLNEEIFASPFLYLYVGLLILTILVIIGLVFYDDIDDITPPDL